MLLNSLSYKKRGRKMLMKLTAGVNFTNIFCASMYVRMYIKKAAEITFVRKKAREKR